MTMTPEKERKGWKFNHNFSYLNTTAGWLGICVAAFEVVSGVYTGFVPHLIWGSVTAILGATNVAWGHIVRKISKKKIAELDEQIAEPAQTRSTPEADQSVGRDRSADHTNSGDELEVADGEGSGSRRRGTNTRNGVPLSADPSNPDVTRLDGDPDRDELVPDDETARPAPPPLRSGATAGESHTHEMSLL